MMAGDATLILNVDDVEAIRYARTRVLQRAGFQVIEAATGAEAVQQFQARQPPLVVLDVNLPDMTGFEICQAVKAENPSTAVLHVSASASEQHHRLRGLQHGADFYLVDPVDPDDLITAVRTLLRLREAEEETRRKDELHRLVLDNVIDYAIFSTNPGGRVATWNAGAHRILGWSEEEAMGHGIAALLHPDSTGMSDAFVLSQMQRGGERWQSRRDGTRFWSTARVSPLREPDGVPVGYLIVIRDLTDQKLAEEELKQVNRSLEQRVAMRTRELQDSNTQLMSEIAERERVEGELRQAQKMEALGQLSGGIAHDFNNLLTGIIGGIELFCRRAQSGEIAEAIRFAELAAETANRAVSVTQRLLTFSRRQPLEPKPTDANALVHDMHSLMRHNVGELVAIELALGENVWPIHCDPNQLESALLNLVLNARDAMPDGGRITIATANRVFTHAPLSAGDPGRGDYVMISVQDTGTGMPPEVLQKAFDPFFTTKPAGQGTGLGLSMLFGFIKASGGHVHIESTVGCGTAVQIYLPRFRGSGARPHHVGSGAPAGLLLGAGQTILVVEDETAVRTVTVAMLQELGYTTLQADNAMEALRILDSGARIDLLVADIGLPGTSGERLAEIVRHDHPELRILYITGYGGDDMLAGAEAGSAVERIAKPFVIGELACKVDSILRAPNPDRLPIRN